MNCLQSPKHVGPETNRIVVTGVEREPRRAHRRPNWRGGWGRTGQRQRLRPLSQQGGLAKTGRGRDQRQARLRHTIEDSDQVGARYQIRPWSGKVEFGDKEYTIRHGCHRSRRKRYGGHRTTVIECATPMCAGGNRCLAVGIQSSPSPGWTGHSLSHALPHDRKSRTRPEGSAPAPRDVAGANCAQRLPTLSRVCRGAPSR